MPVANAAEQLILFEGKRPDDSTFFTRYMGVFLLTDMANMVSGTIKI